MTFELNHVIEVFTVLGDFEAPFRIHLRRWRTSSTRSWRLSGISSRGLSACIRSASYGQKQFEFRWEFFFRIKSVREVNSSKSAIGMNGYSERFYVICTVYTSCKIRQIELNLIPSFIQSHGHCTDERLDARCTLIIGSPEPSPDVLVVENLNFKGEILLQVFDDHYQKR